MFPTLSYCIAHNLYRIGVALSLYFLSLSLFQQYICTSSAFTVRGLDSLFSNHHLSMQDRVSIGLKDKRRTLFFTRATRSRFDPKRAEPLLSLRWNSIKLPAGTFEFLSRIGRFHWPPLDSTLRSEGSCWKTGFHGSFQPGGTIVPLGELRLLSVELPRGPIRKKTLTEGFPTLGRIMLIREAYGGACDRVASTASRKDYKLNARRAVLKAQRGRFLSNGSENWHG